VENGKFSEKPFLVHQLSNRNRTLAKPSQTRPLEVSFQEKVPKKENTVGNGNFQLCTPPFEI
jgi:hypothetical protein